jgi:hypothetical protein
MAGQGFLLFLAIPLVLFLFLEQPFGPGWSVAVGVVLALGHGLVASAWTAKLADVRCLWCGRVGPGVGLDVTAGGTRRTMRACSERHRERLAGFFGVFGPLRRPCPVSYLFLLGVRNTLWVGVVIGGWWLADAARHLLP